VLHNFQLVSLFLVLLVAMWEAFVPGRPLIPGWIEFKHDVTEGARAHDIRVGGAFGDYELLAEYCGINLMFVVFLLNQRRSPGARAVLLGLAGLTLLVLFSTVTRGALIAVMASIGYLAFLIRRRLQVVPVTIMLGAISAGVMVMEWYVRTFTNAGSVLDRLMGTKFDGLVPDTRASVWPQAVERWLRNPIIGSGPYYSTEKGLDSWHWPHNLPLYVLNTIGIVGFVFFVWVLWKVWRASAPPTDDLGSPDYAGAYLLMGHVMLAVFLIDELKIEYLRNLVYPYQVWILFATIVAAWQVRRRERTLRPATAPSPGRP
jgi:O-antigen ligase